mgnify:CR=1 FL=1
MEVGRMQGWRDAILHNSRGIAMEMPMIVIHGKDSESLLNAACVLVEHSTRVDVEAMSSWGPKELEDVQLPRMEWGPGRRVVVDRRYHLRTGAILVKVPDPAISNASADPDNGEILHAGAAHIARCTGVLEVVKDFAQTWGVDMKRRIAILHLACRMPKHHQGALRKLVEDHHASTLLVITTTRPFALDHGLHSRGVYVPIPLLDTTWNRSSSFDPLGVALKALESNAHDKSDAFDALDTCAKVDHAVSRIRGLGGDIVAARNSGAKILQDLVKKYKPNKTKGRSES